MGGVRDEQPSRASRKRRSRKRLRFHRRRATTIVGARFLEFFAATIRNKNTRMAYYRAAERFFAWCDRHKIGEIADIEPLHVAAYVEGLGKDFEKPTVKQRLAAIRMLFDWLVTGQVVATKRTRCAGRSTSSKPARLWC